MDTAASSRSSRPEIKTRLRSPFTPASASKRYGRDGELFHVEAETPSKCISPITAISSTRPRTLAVLYLRLEAVDELAAEVPDLLLGGKGPEDKAMGHVRIRDVRPGRDPRPRGLAVSPQGSPHDQERNRALSRKPPAPDRRPRLRPVHRARCVRCRPRLRHRRQAVARGGGAGHSRPEERLAPGRGGRRRQDRRRGRGAAHRAAGFLRRPGAPGGPQAARGPDRGRPDLPTPRRSSPRRRRRAPSSRPRCCASASISTAGARCR